MINGDIFRKQFHSGSDSFIVSVRKANDGSLYMEISVDKRTGPDNTQQRIVIFQEDIDKFDDAVSEAINKIKGAINPNKAYTLEDKRKENRNAYQPWTEQDDNQLTTLFCQGKTIQELSNIFGRNAGAIRSRIEKLELRDKYGAKEG
ncbi:DUF3276 family protein [Chryseolinea sp. T2]|uniref:DUF3276 family protein n=1 Tax=Chryseolinea sp. T2 TaxID=3129255 RepID=UPI003076AACF